MTAPQRTASTKAASVFGSSKPSGLIVSGRPWSLGSADNRVFWDATTMNPQVSVLRLAGKQKIS